MSFWGALGAIGSLAAAPFTGGTSLSWLPAAIGAGGAAADAIAGGRAQGRLQQTGVNQNEDLINQRRYQNALDAAKLNLGAPGQRAANSVRGDILANAQPFKFTGGTKMVGNIPVPVSEGGLNPGIFSPNTRALGGQLSSQALADNTAMNGKAIEAPPALTQNPQAGTLDSILQTAGIIGGLAPTFNDIYKKYQTTKYTEPDPTAGYG